MDSLSEKVKAAPKSAGCYLFKDKEGTIIYVGKSKCLCDRVKQYFQPSNQQDEKGLLLGKLIADVEYRVTASDLDALLLEYRLIKKYQPWFNVQHKYDWPRLDRQALCEGLTRYYLRFDKKKQYPVLEIVTKKERGYTYLGEYRSEGKAKQAWELVNRLYHMPTCRKSLNQQAQTTCLYYQVGQCLGPCAGKVSEEEYQRVVREITRLFGGKNVKKFRELEREMNNLAKQMEFEKAQQVKQDLEAIKHLKRLHSVRFRIPENRDIIICLRSFAEEDFAAFYLGDGKVLFRQDFVEPPSVEDWDIYLDSVKRVEEKAEFDEVLAKSLQNISADKLAILLPKAGEQEQMIKLINKKVLEWY
ncbi:excinuclease UvrABC nuclease subunit [Lachnospiraceae bacterium PF1-22]|uniref:GIY-YIG nuclease family protein n=1 Tax=Ohessyouella blattaphilus TaxID=2949333 RepID=UPI003E2B3BB8